MVRASKKGATIVDIAQRLGVSAMTISRALSGSTEVSEATRKRVVQCARELGYKPNRWARSLVTRRTSIVGVVVPDISHSYFADVTHGIEEVMQRAGYNLLLCLSHMDPDRERSEIEMLVGSRVEGLVVASDQPERSPELFQELEESTIPFVLIDRFFPGFDFPAVLVDDVAVGRLATEHLLELGHRRVACIQGPDISAASLRYQGYVEALRARGIAVRRRWVDSGRFDIASGQEAMRRLLAATPRPSAVFAANDPMAIGAVYAAREAGLDVPGDVSIVGAGNIEGAYHPNPFLTTMDWPREELGRVAADFLIARTLNPAPSTGRALQVFPPRLLRRLSTAAPAS